MQLRVTPPSCHTDYSLSALEFCKVLLKLCIKVKNVWIVLNILNKMQYKNKIGAFLFFFKYFYNYWRFSKKYMGKTKYFYLMICLKLIVRWFPKPQISNFLGASPPCPPQGLCPLTPKGGLGSPLYPQPGENNFSPSASDPITPLHVSKGISLRHSNTVVKRHIVEAM